VNKASGYAGNLQRRVTGNRRAQYAEIQRRFPVKRLGVNHLAARRFAAVSIVLALTAASCPAVADDWPTFMGNGARTGFSVEPGRRINGVDWIYDTGEMILSSPVAGDGIVYIGGNDGALHAVDSVSGSALWLFQTDAWIEGAPAVADGVVYAGAMDRRLYAVASADGSELWRYETSGWIHGSPLVAGGVVYIGSMDHHVYAVDAATGVLRWKYKTGGFVSATLSIVQGSGMLIAAANNGFIYALDADSGLPVWTLDTGGFLEAAPVCGDGRIYIAVSDNAADNDESIDNRMMAVETTSGSIVWQADLETNEMVFSTPALANGTLVASTFRGAIIGFDATGGAELWRREPDDFAYFASLAATESMVVAQDLGGRLVVMEPSSGAYRQVFDGPGEIYSSAVICDGKLYTATTGGSLYALSIAP